MSRATSSVRNPIPSPFPNPPPVDAYPYADNISSPAKQTAKVTDRKTLQASSNVRRAPQDAKFHETHLNRVPPELLQKLRCLTTAETAALKEVVKPTRHEINIYAPLATLLTSLSKRLYDNLPAKVKKSVRKIEFVPNNRKPLTCHPGKAYPNSYAPDVVGVEGSRYTFWDVDQKAWLAIPYHLAFTIIEIKPDDIGDRGTSQAISYSWYQMQACPHRPGVYCLSLNPKSYTIGWVDASGPVKSPPYLWPDCSGDPEVPNDHAHQGDGGAPDQDDGDADENGGENDEAIECDEEGMDEEIDMDREDRTNDSAGGVDESSYDKDEDDGPENEDLPSEDLDANEENRLDVLLSLLYSFYVPKDDHLVRDITIVQHKKTYRPRNTIPTWDIRCGGDLYRDCKLVSCYPPWGRRTAIFEYKHGGNRTIIKDYWFDNARRFDEIAVMNKVHSEGTMPGVVRTVHSEYVKDAKGRRLTTGRQASGGVENRSRIRLVFQSVGEDLQKVKGLKELLKVFFDLNETHRSILNTTGVLHRDISANNILIRPVHRGKVTYHPDGPKFISDILSGSSHKKRRKDTSHCLLIDFDNSAMWKQDPPTEAGASKTLAQRTGTPMYIARAISIGHRQGEYECQRTFLRMPELSGRALELYVEAWGQKMYDQYCDTGETCHGATIPSDDELLERYETGMADLVNHKPHHDVESMWWSIYITSIQLVPKCTEPDLVRAHFNTAWQKLQAHRIDDPNGPESDCRDDIFTHLADDIKKTLHPGLRSSPLPQLLLALGKQIRPEYELLRGEFPLQEHLHEAMRRVLLEFIVDMEDKPDIEFDTEKKRTFYDATNNDDDNMFSTGQKRTRTEDLAGDNARHVVTRQRREFGHLIMIYSATSM